MGINIFTDEQLTLVFDHYLTSLDSSENKLFYRDLVTHLFNINVNQLGPSDNKSHFTETKSFTGNKHDQFDETESVKKMIEFIIFKLRKGNLNSFLILYQDMLNRD